MKLRKRRKNKKDFHIHLEQHLYDSIVEADFGGSMISRVVTCVKMHVDMPVIVFKATNSTSGKIFYGITKRGYFFEDDFTFRVSMGDEPFSKEVKRLGKNEFEFIPVASFKSLGEALTYKEFLVNRELNHGRECYNTKFDMHPFTRYLVIPFTPSTLERFLKICFHNETTVNKVLGKMIRLFNKRNKPN